MSSATPVSAYEQHRWKVRDCFNIAADAYAFSYFTGRVSAVSGGQEL